MVLFHQVFRLESKRKICRDWHIQFIHYFLIVKFSMIRENYFYCKHRFIFLQFANMHFDSRRIINFSCFFRVVLSIVWWIYMLRISMACFPHGRDSLFRSIKQEIFVRPLSASNSKLDSQLLCSNLFVIHLRQYPYSMYSDDDDSS